MKKLVTKIMRELTKAGYYVTVDSYYNGVLTIKESMYDCSVDAVTIKIVESMYYDGKFTITMPYAFERTNSGIYDALYQYYNGRVIQK